MIGLFYEFLRWRKVLDNQNLFRKNVYYKYMGVKVDNFKLFRHVEGIWNIVWVFNTSFQILCRGPQISAMNLIV